MVHTTFIWNDLSQMKWRKKNISTFPDQDIISSNIDLWWWYQPAQMAVAKWWDDTRQFFFIHSSFGLPEWEEPQALEQGKGLDNIRGCCDGDGVGLLPPYAVRRMMWTPLSVSMMSLISPTLRAYVASSKGFCICLLPKVPIKDS